VQKWIRKLVPAAALLAMVTAAVPAAPASAAPYRSYNYSYWGETVASPQSYLPETSIDGKGLGIGGFRAPEDLFVARNGTVYLLDSGNGRVVVMDGNWQVKATIDGFDNGGTAESFNNPQGIFATEAGDIYVADTDNGRIVQLNAAGGLVRIIGAPKSDVFRADFKFHPKKIALDKAGRIYVVGKGVFDGIMEFGSDGEFSGFLGTNRVRFDAVDYFWKIVSTKKQREQMVQFVPTEFTSLDLSEDGFIFASNADAFSDAPLKKLNPTGFDVLRREGYFSPRGDLRFESTITGPGNSLFIDVKVGESGMYSGLDARKGRIFTYDEDGNLLYIFGQLGLQEGTFKNPVAVERLGDRMLVLDKGYNRISVFRPTIFASTVNEAVMHHYNGEEEKSADAWRKVIRLNANYEIAYIGIGKSLLRQGKYKESLYYFKNGMSRYYYSKAYQMYRKEVLGRYFGTAMTVAVALAAALIAYRIFRRFRRKGAVTHAA